MIFQSDCHLINTQYMGFISFFVAKNASVEPAKEKIDSLIQF